MFEVSWSDPALEELADVYVGVDPTARQVIAAAVGMLNARLADDPMAEGESRGRETDRVVFLGPVRVWAEVNVPARTVRVYRFKA
ncbi:MAG TPA: hypothetical protein VFG68_09065 [Fimbriiglobus sp.]|nr:hypothetical protein [Fimbriiglobus sp.]